MALSLPQSGAIALGAALLPLVDYRVLLLAMAAVTGAGAGWLLLVSAAEDTAKGVGKGAGAMGESATASSSGRVQ
jgi:hypothetical protein